MYKYKDSAGKFIWFVPNLRLAGAGSFFWGGSPSLPSPRQSREPEVGNQPFWGEFSSSLPYHTHLADQSQGLSWTSGLVCFALKCFCQHSVRSARALLWFEHLRSKDLLSKSGDQSPRWTPSRWIPPETLFFWLCLPCTVVLYSCLLIFIALFSLLSIMLNLWDAVSSYCYPIDGTNRDRHHLNGNTPWTLICQSLMNSQTWSPSHSATVQGSSQGWSPRRSPAQRTIWYDDRMTGWHVTGWQEDRMTRY